METLLNSVLGYLFCGVIVIYIMFKNGLFFFTRVVQGGDEAVPLDAIETSLEFCMNVGLFITACIVWPLVLLNALQLEHLEAFDDDEQ
jgi:hypothetical protein